MVTRVKRTSFERKCITKSAKRLYHGMGRQVFKLILAVERPGKKRANEQKSDD